MDQRCWCWFVQTCAVARDHGAAWICKSWSSLCPFAGNKRHCVDTGAALCTWLLSACLPLNVKNPAIVPVREVGEGFLFMMTRWQWWRCPRVPPPSYEQESQGWTGPRASAIHLSNLQAPGLTSSVRQWRCLRTTALYCTDFSFLLQHVHISSQAPWSDAEIIDDVINFLVWQIEF